MGAEEVQVTAQATKEAPNGGFRSWIVATGGCAAQMCTFGYINTFGTYQSYYAKSLLPDYSPSSISWIGSLQTFCLYLLGVISGPLSDRFGVRVILIPASVTLVLSIMMTSLSTEYYQLILTQGVLGGLANGMIFTPAMSCVGQYFTTRRATAMGFGISGAAIGGIVFPIVLQQLLARIGFGWAVRVVGLLILVVVLYMSATMREFAPRRPRGLFIPGAFRHMPYLLANLAFLLSLLGSYTPMFYIVEYGTAMGMDTELAWYQVAIFNAASFFGRLIPNFAGDKFGRFNLSIGCYTVCGIICLCWTAATTTPGILTWNIFYGFFSGAIFSLYSPTVAQVCPSISDIGTYIGQGSALCSFGALAGTPLNGALIRRYGYLSASLFSGLSILAGAGCLIAARIMLGKKFLQAI